MSGSLLTMQDAELDALRAAWREASKADRACRGRRCHERYGAEAFAAYHDYLAAGALGARDRPTLRQARDWFEPPAPRQAIVEPAPRLSRWGRFVRYWRRVFGEPWIVDDPAERRGEWR